MSKSKTYADNIHTCILNIDLVIKFIFQIVGKVVGEVENACYQDFLLVPKCLPSSCSSWSLKPDGTVKVEKGALIAGQQLTHQTWDLYQQLWVSSFVFYQYVDYLACSNILDLIGWLYWG